MRSEDNNKIDATSEDVLDFKPSDASIYVIDDVEEQRDVICRMLEAQGYQLRAYGSGQSFLREESISELGCILLDNQMPGLTGLQVQEELLKRKINTPILFMSGESVYGDVVDAVRKGAFGFLQKPFTMNELLEQVEQAVQESVRRSQSSAEKNDLSRLFRSLTPRELQVYQLVISGFTNKAISKDLNISVGTVEFHRSNLMKKLRVSSLAELIAISRQQADL